MCLLKNKHIICSGLDSDWAGYDFGNTSKLLSLSTKFTKLLGPPCSRCSECYPSFTRGLIIDNCSRSAKITGSLDYQIDTNTKYIPLCLRHHKDHLNHNQFNPDNYISIDQRREQNEIDDDYDNWWSGGHT